MTNQTKNILEITGRVLNIQRYCSHDGPGMRTNVFIKGCSLRCKWCGNPESIRMKPEVSYDPKKCKGKECSICLKAPFPEGGFYFVEGDESKVKVNWQLAARHYRGNCIALPHRRARNVWQNNDSWRSNGRSGKRCIYLPKYRWRYDNQWWRSNVATRFCCSFIAGSPQQRYQYSNRNCV